MERGAVLFLFSGCLVSNGTEIKRLVKFIFIYIYKYIILVLPN
jgi:hypothetical protein